MTSISDHVLGLLPAVVTAILGVIASILTYFIGRRAKLDDLRIKHGHEYAGKLATTFEQLHEHVTHLERFMEINFPNSDNYAEIAEYVSTMPLYAANLHAVDKMNECCSQVRDLLPSARVYLRASFIDLFTAYLETLMFQYMTDGGLGLHDEYIAKLLENLDDTAKQSERAKLAASIRRSFRNAST